MTNTTTSTPSTSLTDTAAADDPAWGTAEATRPAGQATGPAPFDPRGPFARAVAIGGATIAGVRTDRLDDPTPCDDIDVRHLLGHLVIVLRKVAAIGRGEDVSGAPMFLEDVADDGWLAAWTEAAHEVQAAWTADDRLTMVVTLPWATLPGFAALASYVNEVTVHTWDLATATGQQPAWDDEVVGVAFAAIRAGLPAEGRAEAFEEFRANLPEGVPFSAPFGPAVDVPADAPLIEQLVAWNGRRP